MVVTFCARVADALYFISVIWRTKKGAMRDGIGALYSTLHTSIHTIKFVEAEKQTNRLEKKQYTLAFI